MKLFFHRKSEQGLATIPTIMALTVLVLAVGMGITTMALTDNFITLGQDYSARALLYAEAGARDALVKIARNKNYTCVATDCYSLDMITGGCASGDGCGRISVSAGVGSIADPKIITSKGLVKSSTRRVQVNVILDSSLNGEIATASWQELTN